MKAWDAYTVETKDAGAFLGGEGLQPTATATTVARPPDGEPDRHRRAVRRDEGAARRLLPARVRGPRRGDRLGARRSPCRGGTVEVRPVMDYEARGLRRPLERAEARAVEPPAEAVDRLFRRGVGTGGRDPDPRARRLRPRRGGGPGRVRRRARALAARRAARATRPPGSRPPRATRRSTGSARARAAARTSVRELRAARAGRRARTR